MIGNIFRRKPPEQRFDETVHAALADKAANLLGHFQSGSTEFKSAIARNLVHSAAKVAEEIGAKGLDGLIDANAHASILQAADTASRIASLLSVNGGDAKMALASDAYATIAVLLYGNRGFYRDIPARQSVFTMAATLYGYAKAADLD